MRPLFKSFAICVWTFSCSVSDPAVPLQSAHNALSTDQCLFFETNGRVTICHATSSAKNPFVVVRVSEQACVNSHASHPGDYVAVGDPTCAGLGCLPENAPCDATLGCCEGFACTNGTCTRVDPAIAPTSGPPTSAFTITDPGGRLASGRFIVFFQLGQAPSQGVTVTDPSFSADGRTATGTVPITLLPAEYLITVHVNDISDAPLFNALNFVVTG